MASRVVAASDDRSCDARLRGTVLDRAGAPLRGAEIRFDLRGAVMATTDRLGRYEVCVAAEITSLELSAPGFGAQAAAAPERPAVRLTETDADGYFSLMLPPGELAVDVEGFELRALRLDRQLGPATAYVDVAP